MAAQPPAYQRLPARGLALAASYRLYRASDHLLQICSTGYSEAYKRFYYRDIQALIIQPSRLFLILNWIFGFLTFCCAVIWVIDLADARANDPGSVVLGVVVTLVCAAPLALNLLAGPTCACYVRTAVQTERLRSLQRRRAARRVLEQIKPLIESAQRALPPVEPQPGMSAFAETPPVADIPPASEPTFPSPGAPSASAPG
jgi:hypothetical protein